MDYTPLAIEWLQKMHLLRQARVQRNINSSLHGEAFILHFIARRKDAVLPSDISRNMGVSSAMVAATLNRLESKGLITRQIDQNDRRRILVKTTQEGNDLADKHYQSVLSAAEKMLSLLGERDAQDYIRLTGKLADIVSAHKEHL